jgi:hypothetical protein
LASVVDLDAFAKPPKPSDFKGFGDFCFLKKIRERFNRSLEIVLLTFCIYQLLEGLQ